jgi:hypothetical protein
MLYVWFFYLSIGVALTTTTDFHRRDSNTMSQGETIALHIAFTVLWAPIIAAVVVTDKSG